MPFHVRGICTIITSQHLTGRSVAVPARKKRYTSDKHLTSSMAQIQYVNRSRTVFLRPETVRFRRLRSSHDNLQSECEALKCQLSDLRSEKESLVERERSTAKEIADLNGKVSDMKALVHRESLTAKEIAGLQTTISKLEQRAREHVSWVRCLQTDVSRLEEDIHEKEAALKGQYELGRQAALNTTQAVTDGRLEIQQSTIDRLKKQMEKLHQKQSATDKRHEASLAAAEVTIRSHQEQFEIAADHCADLSELVLELERNNQDELLAAQNILGHQGTVSLSILMPSGRR
jgi:hypothetical protein